MSKQKRTKLATRSAPERPEATAEYAQFLRQLRLTDVSLEAGTFNIDRPEYFDLMDRDDDYTMSIKVGGQSARSGKDFFDARAVCEVSVLDGRDETEVLSVNCIYHIHIHSSAHVGHKDFVKRFIESELRIITWPYVRQFVTDITSRMAIPPITIPLSTDPGFKNHDGDESDKEQELLK